MGALADQTSKLAVTISRIDRLIYAIDRRTNAIVNVVNEWGSEDATVGHELSLVSAKESIERAFESLNATLTFLQDARMKALDAKQVTDAQRIMAEDQARGLRKEIDVIQEGAGQTSRQMQQLRERRAEIESLRSSLEVRQSDLAKATTRRAEALENLEKERNARFLRREETAEMLNARLGPRIKITAERAGQVEAYSRQLAGFLKGSGLRANEISQSLAQTVSPRELLEWAEADDIVSLAEATGFTRDRAARVLAALRSSDLGELGTLLVDDDVQFFLLDGSDHKSVSMLSTGQRCTVVLSVVLERRDTVIIVDQPEDHIDNAFISETLVRAIADRAIDGQIILTTHNANIPVLGNASHVIQMDSDGRRGFVAVSAPLFDEQSVYAITSIMEGGREAFRRRADFYSRHEQ